MEIDGRKIIQQSIEYSKLLKQKLENSKIEFIKKIKFNSCEFRNIQTLKKYLDEIENSEIPIVYVIRVADKRTANLLESNFLKFTANNKKKIKNKDRINISRFNKTSSKVLYVGSSTTDFKTRIKNHLGVMGGRVYSLHLSKWDCDLEYDIIIDIFKIKSLDGSTILERFVVEIIEQQIWEKLKPIFGKKSGL